MSMPDPTPDPEPEGRGWAKSLVLGLVVLAIYLANGREIGTYDTQPTSLLPLTILRGEGPHLDRFRPILREADGRLPVYVRQSRGHIVSRYPLGPALVALPLVSPQVFAMDRLSPGWDAHPVIAWNQSTRMAKRASAMLAALTAVVLYRLLRDLGLGRVAMLATAAAALGSDMWVVASQALWQHGPAALALVSAVALLARRDLSRMGFFFAGVAAGILVLCRAMDLVFAAILLVHVGWKHPRRLGWFVPAPLLLAAGLLAYNLAYFGVVSGGQAELEAKHPELHGFPGPWSGDFVDGALGTLLSPSRGLFVYSPWVPLALISLPFVYRRIRTRPPLVCVGVGLVAYYVILAKYAVWWGGYCFGPRYWTDVMPLLAILLAYGLDAARARSRLLFALFVLAIVVSVAIQAIGAFCYPSSWCLSPTNIDLDHARLWDWWDSEVSRSLKEAAKQPSRFQSL